MAITLNGSTMEVSGGAEDDAFYTTFSGGALSGLVATKRIEI